MACFGRGYITTPSGNNTVAVSNSTSNGEIDFCFDSNFDSSIVPGSDYKIIFAVNNTSLPDVKGGSTANGTKIQIPGSNITLSSKMGKV